MKTGLVLEGGGMRGLFTAGVIDVLMENGIEFDGAVQWVFRQAQPLVVTTRHGRLDVPFATTNALQTTDGMPRGGRFSPLATTLMLILPTITFLTS